jgi:suppressor of G2 allele of SKP1
MAGRTAYNQANDFFVDEQYKQALEKYNEAISLEQDNSEYFIKRSNCNFKLQNYTDALEDANESVRLTPHNANAYYRKGVALFHLDEFESAKATFQKGYDLDRGDLSSQFKIWLRKCDAELKSEQDAQPQSAPQSAPAPTPTPTPAPTPAPAPVQEAAPAKVPPRYRHEWYQTSDFVIVTIFAKNVPKENLEVQIQENELDVTIKVSDSEDFSLSFNLCDKIIPEKSSTNHLSMKIEIKLKKSQVLNWATLERSSQHALRPYADTSAVDKHAYPSSSKKKIDWDSLNKSVEEDKVEGDAALNKVLSDVYKGGSEEQRRAMMKSFYESGGTVLSTNWTDVGSRYVEGSPPKGMEMHKWNEN